MRNQKWSLLDYQIIWVKSYDGEREEKMKPNPIVQKEKVWSYNQLVISLSDLAELGG